MTLNFSMHATKRMLERGITEDEVRAVYAEPEYSYPSDTDKTVRTYVGKEIIVSVGKRQRVLTVHRRSQGGVQDSRPLNPRH